MQRCAASVTPPLIHWRNDRPLVGLGPIALCGVEAVTAIVAAHGVDVSVKQNCAHIAATEVHGSHIVPRVRVEVKLAHTVEILHPVKATQAVETTVVEHRAVVGTGGLQVLFNIDPKVRAEVIGLDAFGWIVAAPATDGQEDFLGEAGTGDGVSDGVARGEVLSHQILDLQGVVHHLQALSILTDKLVQLDVDVDEVLTNQGQADLHQVAKEIQVKQDYLPGCRIGQ